MSKERRFQELPPENVVDIVSIIDETELARLRELEIQIINQGDSRDSKKDFEAEIFFNRGVLTAIESQLRQLNAKYPGERLKDDSEQSPNFREQRDELLRVKRLLVGQQREARGVVAQYHKQKANRLFM